MKSVSQDIVGSMPDALQMYLRDLERIPRISREEEERLIVKAKQGDKESYDKVINVNLRFVVSVAVKYVNSKASFADLIAEGNCGLVEAFNRFDPSKGFKFISYAVWWIRQRIISYLKQNKIVRAPTNVVEIAYRLQVHRDQMTQNLGYTPKVSDVMYDLKDDTRITFPEYAGTHIGRASVENALRAEISLDKQIKSDEGSNAYPIDILEDMDVDPADKMAQDNELHGLIQNSINKALSPRESHIVSMYFGIDRSIAYGEQTTLETIGESLGITRERVRQILARALPKLKRYMQNEMGHDSIEDLLTSI